MKVIIIPDGCTPNPEEHIGKMAAICYGADKSRDSNLRRTEKCKSTGHLSVMRFAYATFNISGISRVCSHQLVRIAHAGILQRSQRYVDSSLVEFIVPPAFAGLSEQTNRDWEELQICSAALYLKLIDEGIRKEDARFALLQACETEMNICLNFQAWEDFLKNRDSEKAQWEIRDVATEIRKKLHQLAPSVFPVYEAMRRREYPKAVV